MQPIVALLTDFGPSEYVGQMKGVLLRLAPQARLVDLCHTVEPQAIPEGAWLLWTSYRHFPPGTLFLAVVDPGVGTDRPAVAVQSRNYRWVGPDNGLLYPAVAEDGLVAAVRLPVHQDASPTFHGRDVFAPAAGRWAAGAELGSLGAAVPGLEVRLDLSAVDGVGEVVRVDAFGNLITTLRPPDVAAQAGGSPTWLRVRLETQGPREVRVRLVRTYGAARPGELVAVVGSAGTLELSVVGGSAARALGVRRGARVAVHSEPPGREPSAGAADATGGAGGA